MAAVKPSRYYCTGCPNDPSVPCCHMHPAERVEIMDCRCAALGIKLKPGNPKEPSGG